MDLFKWLFGPGHFMSHGHCYLWNPALVGLHATSDVLIAIAYVAISCTLLYLVRHSHGILPFHWMFSLFGLFIVACAGTHMLEVVTIWTPVYWLSGFVKLLTAAASVTTAVTLPPLVPKARKLVAAAQLSEERRRALGKANTELQKEIEERRRAEEEIRNLNLELEKRVEERTAELARVNETLRRTAAIVEYSRDAIYSTNPNGAVTSWNPAAENIFGYPAESIKGQSFFVLVPEDRKEEATAIAAQLRQGQSAERFETVRMRSDGTRIDVSVTMSPIRDDAGQFAGASVIARDITEAKRAEQRFRETQKLEGLGLIAGGVAHDFNNLLVGILGNGSMALEMVAPSNPIHALLRQVVAASEKAATLTRQLLAYAGKGRFVTERVDASRLVREISGLIHASIPRNVQIRLELAEGLPVVDADPGQLQQLIMNLVINGAEAVPEGQAGTVLVTTSEQRADDAYLRNNFSDEKLKPGLYVTIEVHDTGSGMSEEVRRKIFDPFFTTKFTGRGLGLAAALGIVRGHKGAIRVYSVPGKGSTFKILLPAIAGVAEAPAAGARTEEMKGSGTILIVDDEPGVRSTAKAALEWYGYQVLEAGDGAEGIEVYGQHADSIVAVLLDMTMPVVGGEEAFRRMRAINPEVKVVLTSGYNEAEAVRRFTTKGLVAFIQKPYTAAKLAQTLKQAIEDAG